jgi:hypothetical protein
MACGYGGAIEAQRGSPGISPVSKRTRLSSKCPWIASIRGYVNRAARSSSFADQRGSEHDLQALQHCVCGTYEHTYSIRLQFYAADAKDILVSVH